jgi:hypothetical protein
MPVAVEFALLVDEPPVPEPPVLLVEEPPVPEPPDPPSPPFVDVPVVEPEVSSPHAASSAARPSAARGRRLRGRGAIRGVDMEGGLFLRCGSERCGAERGPMPPSLGLPYFDRADTVNASRTNTTRNRIRKIAAYRE